jgi:hypothetical protein
MAKTPEGKIKAAILKYLKRRDIYVWNNPTGAVEIRPGEWIRFGKKGSADLLGCLSGGRLLAIEVKAPGNRLSPTQREFLETIRGLGGLALTVKSWKELDTALRQGGYISDGPLFDLE